MRIGHVFGFFWHGHTQNLDDSDKIDLADDALTAALAALGVLRNDNWRELAAVRSAFHDRLRGRLGHGWRNGRGWWSLYRGDPDQGGRRLLSLGAQWVLCKRQHSIGIDLNVGTGDGDRDLTGSIRIPGFGLYLTAEDAIPRWAAPRRKTRINGRAVALPSPRELGIAWHDGKLWIKLWSDMHEWSSRAPFWDARSKWRQPTIDPARILFGRERCATEILESSPALVRLPEGNYPVAVTIERRTWSRPRLFWRRKVRIAADVRSEQGMPIPGKGENAWDCEDDAIYGMGVAARTVADATRMAADRVVAERLRLGGVDWMPAAGWPALGSGV